MSLLDLTFDIFKNNLFIIYLFYYVLFLYNFIS